MEFQQTPAASKVEADQLRFRWSIPVLFAGCQLVQLPEFNQQVRKFAVRFISSAFPVLLVFPYLFVGQQKNPIRGLRPSKMSPTRQIDRPDGERERKHPTFSSSDISVPSDSNGWFLMSTIDLIWLGCQISECFLDHIPINEHETQINFRRNIPNRRITLRHLWYDAVNWPSCKDLITQKPIKNSNLKKKEKNQGPMDQIQHRNSKIRSIQDLERDGAAVDEG